jgi:hypothetical protein
MLLDPRIIPTPSRHRLICNQHPCESNLIDGAMLLGVTYTGVSVRDPYLRWCGGASSQLARNSISRMIYLQASAEQRSHATGCGSYILRQFHKRTCQCSRHIDAKCRQSWGAVRDRRSDWAPIFPWVEWQISAPEWIAARRQQPERMSSRSAEKLDEKRPRLHARRSGDRDVSL